MSVEKLKYSGPIFDAHTHVIDLDALRLLVKVQEKYGIKKSLAIVHGDSFKEYENAFPGRFIFARYFSGWTVFTEGPEEAAGEAATLRKRGYGMVKMHFAPFWSDRLSEIEHVPAIDSHTFDPLFDAISDEGLPLLVHIADPDTYFATRYTDARVYGTKEEHLQEFENRLYRNPNLTFQAAHFAAQPEPHRLENLGRMFDKYPNLNVDLGSARWMCREFGRGPKQARDFILRNADRILFGTDCVASKMDEAYYNGRYSSLRLMLESDLVNEPLPFEDADTVGSGGTFINGLELPESALDKVYWANAKRIHDF
jgi:predicted TIM-barrel fold metal-dependent hydrolase